MLAKAFFSQPERDKTGVERIEDVIACIDYCNPSLATKLR